MKIVLGSYDQVPHPYHHQFLGNLSEWTISDINPRFPNVEKIDALDIPYKEVEALYASHILEHIANPEVALKHWFDTLETGGWVQINVPDVEWALDQIMKLNNNESTDSTYFNNKENIYKIINGTEESFYDTHKSWFTLNKLKLMLEESGFKNIEIKREYEAHDMMCIIAKAFK